MAFLSPERQVGKQAGFSGALCSFLPPGPFVWGRAEARNGTAGDIISGALGRRRERSALEERCSAFLRRPGGKEEATAKEPQTQFAQLLFQKAGKVFNLNQTQLPLPALLSGNYCKVKTNWLCAEAQSKFRCDEHYKQMPKSFKANPPPPSTASASTLASKHEKDFNMLYLPTFP